MIKSLSIIYSSHPKFLMLLAFLINFSMAQIIFPNEDDKVKLQTYGACWTPNHERALCIHLEQCISLFNLLRNQPLSNGIKEFLRQSQCGTYNGQVLICCPDFNNRVQILNVREREPLEMTSRTTLLSIHPTSKANRLLPQPGQCGRFFSNRIYGGNKTKIDEFPWMTLIEYTKANNVKDHHCGGTLINSRYVLTASHCVNGPFLPSDWRLSGVRLGEWDINTNPDCEYDVRGKADCAPPHIDVAVEQAVTHPQYNPHSSNQLHDIALLRLALDITYTYFVQPICLPVNDILKSDSFDYKILYVAGWGKTEDLSRSSVKLKAFVEGMPRQKCYEVYKTRNIHIQNSQLCAGGQEGIDSCKGDSGGPLMGRDTTNRTNSYYFLVGIVSFGPTPCGLEGWPGVYTRISNYMEWITQNIEA